ncbi:MAG: peptidylprolyl isomerase [Ferruginibacter sp.]
MKKLFCIFLFSVTAIAAQSQTIAQIKNILDTTSNPVGFVKFVLKKKFFIDTVAVLSSNSFLGKADSLAYNGKTGKTYGPFKGENILVKILTKVPNTFYHVNHIVLDTSTFTQRYAEQLANDIIRKIESGTETFATMASTYSSDFSSARKGGDLGWFVRGVMLPQLDEALTTHKKGTLFKVWTAAGLHIVKIADNPKKDTGYALLLRVIL